LHWLDLSVLILYAGLLIGLGFYRSKESGKDPEEYLLAGRKLSLPGFVATLVATWYGGILGIGENTYAYGLQTWFILGFPYYVFALLYALLPDVLTKSGVFPCPTSSINASVKLQE